VYSLLIFQCFLWGFGIYDSNHSNILDILHDFNKIHPNLIFTAEQEKEQKLNFLDITIHKTPNSWDFSIHRKPTFTDTIIPYDSNHPHQNKYAATRFLYNRLHTYNTQGDQLKTETSTITNILHNNGFPTWVSCRATIRPHFFGHVLILKA
jgi:hypothetical protein